MKTAPFVLTLFLSAFFLTPAFSQEHHRELVVREITLTGKGYDLGLQHGKQLKNEIAGIIKARNNKYVSMAGDDYAKTVDEFFVYARFDEAIKKWTPELYEEVKGIADGSGQPFRDIMLLNLLDEFWVFIDQKFNHHCSGIGIPANDGKPGYIGQNMDLEAYTHGFVVLMRIQPGNGKPEQLVLTHPGLVALNGMNETGVGVCVNTLMQLKASPSGLPVAFIVRRLIGSTDKDEMLDFLHKVPHASGQNYLLGIRGEVFDFEASANKLGRFDPENENGAVYHTNHPIVNDDLKDWYKPDSGDITDDPNNGNSIARFEAVRTRISEPDWISDDMIKDALRSMDDPENPVCNRYQNEFGSVTFASIIMTHSGRPFIQLTAGPPDELDYIQFNFTK